MFFWQVYLPIDGHQPFVSQPDKIHPRSCGGPWGPPNHQDDRFGPTNCGPSCNRRRLHIITSGLGPVPPSRRISLDTRDGTAGPSHWPYVTEVLSPWPRTMGKRLPTQSLWFVQVCPCPAMPSVVPLPLARGYIMDTILTAFIPPHRSDSQLFSLLLHLHSFISIVFTTQIAFEYVQGLERQVRTPPLSSFSLVLKLLFRPASPDTTSASESDKVLPNVHYFRTPSQLKRRTGHGGRLQTPH
jgi:hypothetical protein